MQVRTVLHDHQDLRRKAEVAIRRLSELAEMDGSAVTVQNRTIKRSQAITEVADRLNKDEFVLAVVGEFSRGKSSLINSLLEQPALLPTSIEPSTAAITVLRYGEEQKISVDFTDGTSIDNVTPEGLSQYVLGQNLDGSEQMAEMTRKVVEAQKAGKLEKLAEEVLAQDATGPEVAGKRVKTVNILLPSTFLADGICLVDTPGIGSVNPQHGEATRGFINRADAVIFLINTDPVISQGECHFLAFLKDYVNRFLFVVTKIDRYTETERNQSVEYTRRTIEQYAGIASPQMYPLSAKMAQDARDAGDDAKFAASGFADFLQGLDVFLIRARGESFIREQVNNALAHLNDLRNACNVELQGLELSMEDLQTRIEATRPALVRAHGKGKDIMVSLERGVKRVQELIEGSGVGDMRLYYTIRDAVNAQLDAYEWKQLQAASQTIPLFVRDELQEALQKRLDAISHRVATLRIEIVDASRELVGIMSEELSGQFEAMRVPHQLDFKFDFDPDAFRADLQKVTTITIGGTLALSLGSLLAVGTGVGAVVLLGGLIAGHTVTSVYRNRVKDQLKQTLDPQLLEVIRTIYTNIREQVEANLREFRAEIDSLMESAIANVENTLERLDRQRKSAEFNSSERTEKLRGQQTALEEIESELSLVAGPGF